MKYKVTLKGRTYEIEVEAGEAILLDEYEAIAPSAPAAAPAAAADGQKVLSPMPGTILSVNVSVGSAVKAGDVLLILEAMKMENEIVAPCDGTVKQLAVQKGSTVATDALLAVVG